jgi:hypothetical protein
VKTFMGISTSTTAFERYSSANIGVAGATSTIGGNEAGPTNIRILSLTSDTVYYPLFKNASATYALTPDPNRSWWTLVRIA